MVAHRWFSRPVHSAALPYFRARVSLPGAPLNRTRNCATPGPLGRWDALEGSTLLAITGFGLCRVTKWGKPDTLRPKTVFGGPAPAPNRPRHQQTYARDRNRTHQY